MNNTEELSRLVEKYHNNLEQYKENYNETQLRSDFVNPFFKLLGWDVDNKSNLPENLREVKQEASVIVEENDVKKKKKPDYAFKYKGQTKFFVETKKPAVDILKNKNAAFQLKRYGWSGELKISILFNFNDLVIYDCTIVPTAEDNTDKGLIQHFHYTDYVSNFNEIYELLSRESVEKGCFDLKFRDVSNEYKRQPFNEYFLLQIKKWRDLISKDIFSNFPSIDCYTLNVYTQKILNRLLFLRICEDRGIEEFEYLKNLKKYSELEKAFSEANKKYNSGLFDLSEENGLDISVDVIKTVINDLYYPNSSYEFSVVDPYIIGQIYELFLEEEIVIIDEEIAVKHKPENIESNGVVNTPRFIAERIVKDTLDPLFFGREIEDVVNIRIADICCGSGIFLLLAFDYLQNYYFEALLRLDESEGKIYTDPITGDKRLSFEMKRNILVRHLYGVDIDDLAVEVAKFSLLLKCVENSSLFELQSFVKNKHLSILPNINSNIKSGNSLIGPDYKIFNPKADDEELINKVNMFDWDEEFFSNFNNEKFDAIIGNPPYVRVQKLVTYLQEQYNYFKSDTCVYTTSKTGTLDKYYLFIEQAMNLIKEDGRVGYIVPHRFMTNEAGMELRRFLSAERYVNSIIHFQTLQLFKKRSTYTCILNLSNKKNEKFTISFVNDLNDFLSDNLKFKEYNINFLNEKPWIFMSDEVLKKLKKIKDKCVRLDSLTNIFVGLQTSKDKFYIINPKSRENDCVKFEDMCGKEREIEIGILKPCLHDIQLTKYFSVDYNSYIIFPYTYVNDKLVLYTLEEIEKNFPKCYEYFNDFKEELKNRSIKNSNDENWHQFGRSQSLEKFSGKEHLIWQVLSNDSNYVYDDKSTTFTGGGNGPFYGLEVKNETKESIYYIQAILNHQFIENLVKNKSNSFRGDYYSHGKQFIIDLPIRKIDFSNKKEKEIHDSIVESIKKIMDYNNNLSTLMGGRKEKYRRLINEEHKQINQKINDLYEI